MNSKSLESSLEQHGEKNPCHVTDCAYSSDCEIMRILGKAPPKGKKCSYFTKDRTGKKKTVSGDAGEEL